MKRIEEKSFAHRSPSILLPYGPWSWSSTWQGTADWVELMSTTRSRTLHVPYLRGPELDQCEDLFLNSSAWIFPTGCVNLGALKFLEQLRKINSNIPAIIFPGGEGARGALTLVGHRSVLKSNDTLVVPCQAERQLLLRAFPKAGKNIVVLPFPVAQGFTPLSLGEVSAFRRSIGLGSKDPLIVYAGRLSLQKNVHLLIEAFAGVLKVHPTAQLHIIGGVDEMGLPHLGERSELSYAFTLSACVQRLRIENSVKFLGPQDSLTRRKYLASCDLQASLTTHYGEDFGLSISQGMACGAPTVITQWGGGKDFVAGDGAYGVPVTIYNGRPTVQLEKAVHGMLEVLQTHKKSKWKSRALQFSRTHHSKKVISRAWNATLSRLIRRSNPSAFLASNEALRFHRLQRQIYETNAKLGLFAKSGKSVYLDVIKEYSR